MQSGSGSPIFTFNAQDAIKLGKSLLLAATGACLPILSDYLAGTDFGVVTPVVTALGTVAINAVRRFVVDYTS